MTPSEIIKQHMARSFYAQDWADWADRAGFRCREVMDHIPLVAPARYSALVDKAITQLEKSTGYALTGVVALLAGADEVGSPPPKKWLEDLGHDLGMMATGTGVSWFDDHERPTGLDIDMYVANDGIGWDMPDEWYVVPVKAYRFKAGDHDYIYKFPVAVAGYDALETIIVDFGAVWSDVNLETYIFERLE